MHEVKQLIDMKTPEQRLTVTLFALKNGGGWESPRD